MGNRKLRKELTAALKEIGHSGKLYHGSRRIALRALSASRLKEMLRLLSFKPGDLVNDCDGFNHRVKGHRVNDIVWDKDTRVIDLHRLVFDDGGWSCGCPYGPDEPWSIVNILKFHTFNDEEITEQKRLGWWNDKRQAFQDKVRAGGPICDEDGIKL